MFKSLRFGLVISLMAVAVLVLAACGGSSATGSGQAVTVQVTLSEFKVESSVTNFTVGTPYHFVIKNAGTVAHEWLIMPPGSTDTSQALVWVKDTQLQPGATVTQDFTFTQAGNFEMACHLPGHYEGGMHLPITVK